MLALLLSAAGASAQLKFVDAEQLGLVNKLGPTENRYHRVDTDKYDLTQAEANLLAHAGRYGAGVPHQFVADRRADALSQLQHGPP